MGQQQSSDNSFNITAYQGRWYEIGKYYFPIQKDCVNSTADYIYNNGSVFVINTCYDNDSNAIKQNFGIATPTENPGIFSLKFSYETTFNDKNNGYPIASYPSIYKVLWTDYNNYALVGSNNKNVYWILARKPVLNQQEMNFLIKKTIDLGYDPNKIIMNNTNLLVK